MTKKLLFTITLLFHFNIHAQENAQLISWNIRDFGQTKSSEELEQIAEIVRHADIVAIQEVVAGYGGAQAVAKLSDLLNRKGSKWDYVISEPTNSSKYATERYAFIWKTKNIKIKNRGFLVEDLELLVDREPFFLDFYLNGQKFSVINFHSRPHDKNPEAEIKAITDYLSESIIEHPVMLVGDFNVAEQDEVFDDLKSLGYNAALSNKKTTLKRKCDINGYLNHAIDNIFYSDQVTKLKAYSIDFVRYCESLPLARNISDHLPVSLRFQLK